jgi:hypothetical protein
VLPEAPLQWLRLGAEWDRWRISGGLTGQLAIVQIHSGYEYTCFPSDYTCGVYEAVAEAGAALVVGNHTHIAQGMGWTDSGPLALHCLGNFAFDQDRADTMLGQLVEVQQDGTTLRRVHALPTYLEDYRPRLITGALSDRFLRRVAESSDSGTGLAIYADRLWLLPAGEIVREERTVSVTVTVGESGTVDVDLRDHLLPGESVAWLSMPDADEITIGRDLLLFGSFEDEDIDDDAYEAARWDLTSESRETCFGGARSGVLGLCTYRNEASVEDTVAPFRNRVRVWGDGLHTPNKALTLFGYLHGEGAGPVSAVVRCSASVGDNEFGEESFSLSDGGSFGWTAFSHDLTMPPDTDDAEAELLNPRALRLFLHHGPTRAGWGRAAMDDLAVISWEESLAPSGGVLEVPHPREFLRVAAAPGEHTLTLSLEAPRPAVVQ